MAKQSGSGSGTAGGGTGGGGGTAGDVAQQLQNQPVVKEFAEILKKFFKIELDLNTVASALDPHVIDTSAEAAAEKAKKVIKEGNPVLHPACGYILAAISGRLDTVAESISDPLKTGLRKISDWLDTFRSAFYGKSDEKAPEAKPDAELLKKISINEAELGSDFMGFLRQVTNPADRETLEKRGAEQTAAWAKFKHDLLHGPEKEPEAKAPAKPFREHVAKAAEVANAEILKFNAALTPVVEKWEAAAEKATREESQAQARSAKSKSVVGFSWRLTRKLLG